LFSKSQPRHQSCPPENSNQFNLNRLVYTTDVRGDVDGEVVLIPASHKMGELCVGKPDEDFKEQIVMRPQNALW